MRWVTFVQRFNSALELSLHFHILIPDGVFVAGGAQPDDRPRFVVRDAPTDGDVAALLDRILDRTHALLRRRGRLDDDSLDEEAEPHLLLAARPSGSRGDALVEDALPPRCARRDGFSLHAGVAIHRNDRQGLEALCRYGLRPPLAQSRLEEAPDGTLRYRTKRRFSDGREVLRFEPRELLLRLCALVPPPGFHMVRYAGIFAAHARGRHALTGRGMRDRPVEARAATRATTPNPGGAAPTPSWSAPSSSAPGHRARGSSEHAGVANDPGAPDAPSRPRRLDWAALCRRVFAVDVLRCPSCAGPMRIIAFVEDPAIARRILRHLGLPARAPPRGGRWRRPLLPDLVDRRPVDEIDPPHIAD